MSSPWADDPVVGGVPGAPALSYSAPQSFKEPVSSSQTPWADDPVVPTTAPVGQPAANSGGIARNVGAGINEFIAGTAGAPVDLATAGLNLIPGVNIQNPFGGSESIKSGLGYLGADPRDVAQNTGWEKVARTVGSDVMGMLTPWMAARALMAQGIGGAAPVVRKAGSDVLGMMAPDMAARGLVSEGVGAVPSVWGNVLRAFGGTGSPLAGAAENVGVGTAASLAGQGAEALLPKESPYRPLANLGGQVAGGGLGALGLAAGKGAANYIIDQIKSQLAPYLNPEGTVGRQLLRGASDPTALTGAIEEARQLVPGSMPTTYQLTGDQGIGQLERQMRILPEKERTATTGPAPFLERMGEQNRARVEALQGLAPEEGAPSSVRDLFRRLLADEETSAQTQTTEARQGAEQAFGQIGGNLPIEQTGAAMRGELEAAKAAAKGREAALWQAIDPQGTLTINAAPVKQTALDITNAIPQTAKPPEGEERAVLGFAQMLGTAMPFQDFTALRGRLLQAIRDERPNGQTPALRRMQELRASMDDTISQTADAVAQQQAVQVQAGALSPAQTLAQQAADFYAQRGANVPSAVQAIAAGENAGISAAAMPGGGPSGVGGVPGAPGAQAGGLGSAAGGQGLQGQGGIANFDAAAAARYRAAADATRERASTFNNLQVGPVLQERLNQYAVPESRVPERFISSPEGIQAFLQAGGNRGTLADALVGDLRASATNPDGTLNPTKFASWQLRREAALREFPDLQQRLGNVAGAQQAVDIVAGQAKQRLDNFQNGAARYFLNAEPMQAVQSAFASKNPVADFAELARMTNTNADAKAGLQRAVADYISRNFVGNTEAGTSGVAQLKSDAFQTFLKRNDAALSQVFDNEQMSGIRAIAEDLQRSNRSITGSKLPGQSNTAQDLMLQQPTKMSALQHFLWQGGITGLGGIAGYLAGGFPGMAGGSAFAGFGKAALDRLEAMGIKQTNQLMTDALLHPELAKTLIMKATPENQPFFAQRFYQQLNGLLAAQGAKQGERLQ